MKKFPIGIFALVLCVYGLYLVQVSDIELALSPGLFPLLLGLFMLIVGGGISFQRSKEKTPLVLPSLIAAYTGLWFVVGPRISTFAFAGFSLYILKEESLSRSLLFGLLLTLFIDLLFARFFGIQF